MKKVLFIANTDRHIKLCHIPYLKMFKDSGYIVHVATGSDKSLEYCDKKIKINFKRNPFSFLNLFAAFKIRRIVNKEDYDVISCHTPIGGFLGRCSVMFRRHKPKIFYTAHGFHFFKGAKMINWLIYYNVEKFLSRFTDLLVTMNEEDYRIARNKFKCDVVKINGIGLDTRRLKVSNQDMKKEIGIKDKYVITYIAEISKRKNHPLLLKTIKKYDLGKENIVLLLVGDSRIKNFEKKIKKYKNIIYIDFKENVGDYINMSDAIIFPSSQEGLPQSILEAMYFNKVIFSFDIRGCKDIINNGVNGFLIKNNDMNDLISKCIMYKNSNEKLNIKNNIEKYKLESVIDEIKKIYNNYLDKKVY